MLRDEVDLVRLVSVAYEMLLVMSPFVMNEQQWAEYKDNIHEKDRENAYQLWGPRGVNSRGKVEIHSPMGCVPVWPAKNETALEYVGVWVMKLAKKSPSALDQVFKSYPMMVQDVAAFAKVRANGPRLHFSSLNSKVPDATRPIYVFGSHDFRVYKQYHGTLEAWGGPKHESYLNGLSPGHPLYSILQKAIEEAKDFVAVSDAAFY
ncbi:unnamed protein product [Aphanomyces euteiches]